MTHTPGPWPLDYVSAAVRHIVRNCDFIESDTDPYFSWDRYNDARLIVEAPTMCGALRTASDYLVGIEQRTRGTPSHPLVNSHLYEARAILARIDGEEK